MTLQPFNLWTVAQVAAVLVGVTFLAFLWTWLLTDDDHPKH